jgi:hypothetical protein
MFVNGSEQNEQSLERTFHRCFLPSFTSFGWGVSEEKIQMWKVNEQQTTDAKWWQKLMLPLARRAKNLIKWLKYFTLLKKLHIINWFLFKSKYVVLTINVCPSQSTNHRVGKSLINWLNIPPVLPVGQLKITIISDKYCYSVPKYIQYWCIDGKIEFMWRGFSESFHPFHAEPHQFYSYSQYTNIVFILQ